MPAPRSTRLLAITASLGAFALGAISACFNAPASDVLFSCASGDEPACPSGYGCEADGCCHKDGSDVQAQLGGCALGFGGDGGDGETTSETTGETG